jgi:hypothetical protein
MLNPSAADGEEDDPTVRRAVSLFRDAGLPAVEVVNLWALRATDPADLRAALDVGEDAEGPENAAHLLAARLLCAPLVCAWGGSGGRRSSARALALLAPGGALCGAALHAFADEHGDVQECADGSPRHPLMLRSSSRPAPWDPFRPGGPLLPY